MRVMVMMKATKESEAGQMPSEEMLAAMTQFNEELLASGIMLAGEGLHPSSAGKRVRFGGGAKRVIDGPFAETKEVIAGFSIWQVKDMDEALAWAKRSPNPTGGQVEIEIRPFFEAADLAEFMTPEELAAAREGERGKLGVA